ncbi:unnamed protein product [Urochloa humidicola]
MPWRRPLPHRLSSHPSPAGKGPHEEDDEEQAGVQVDQAEGDRVPAAAVASNSDTAAGRSGEQGARMGAVAICVGARTPTSMLRTAHGWPAWRACRHESGQQHLRGGEEDASGYWCGGSPGKPVSPLTPTPCLWMDISKINFSCCKN